jgi:hypothetical protein
MCPSPLPRIKMRLAYHFIVNNVEQRSGRVYRAQKIGDEVKIDVMLDRKEETELTYYLGE